MRVCVCAACVHALILALTFLRNMYLFLFFLTESAETAKYIINNTENLLLFLHVVRCPCMYIQNTFESHRYSL